MRAYTPIMGADQKDQKKSAAASFAASSATTSAAGSADPCFCMQARRASRVLTELYERELAPYDLTLPQFSLLSSCQRLGPVGISEFAAKLGLDRTTLGRNLKLLEKSGLVALQGNSADQRERLVSLTRAGARRLEQALAAWQAAQVKVKQGLGKPGLAALNQLVRQIDTLAA